MSIPERGIRVPAATGDTLLIYAPVSLRERDGITLLEEQACNGLRLWAENFDRLIAMMPLDPGPPPPDWVPVARVGEALARVELIPLPMAYRPDRFLAHLPAVRRRIREAIGRADYLSFAIGGLFGDWGSVACLEAHRLGRPFAVWTDRVESQVVRHSATSGSLKSRLRARLTYRPMALLERAVISRATLGLFHGRETYDAYAPFCRTPEVVHDIHISVRDHIAPDALAAKVAAAAAGPLRIAYVGRASPMKGARDWVEVLERLAAGGADFRAVWIGDGVERPAMLARIAQAGLADRVDMPGFANRDTVLAVLRDSHAFLFCHRTPESPRCLIEALVSGCPIVGYASAFPRDLVAPNGGGLLAPLGDTGGLAQLLAGLASDRGRLADLIGRAARDGAPFDDVSVFRHRSEIIRRHL